MEIKIQIIEEACHDDHNLNLSNLLTLYLWISSTAKILGHTKHTTAEELYKLVLMKKTTYEEIRRIDPVKFMDLEATMRMLYDHGDMTFEDS